MISLQRVDGMNRNVNVRKRKSAGLKPRSRQNSRRRTGNSLQRKRKPAVPLTRPFLSSTSLYIVDSMSMTGMNRRIFWRASSASVCLVAVEAATVAIWRMPSVN